VRQGRQRPIGVFAKMGDPDSRYVRGLLHSLFLALVDPLPCPPACRIAVKAMRPIARKTGKLTGCTT
jgi:hypothetical protein